MLYAASPVRVVFCLLMLSLSLSVVAQKQGSASNPYVLNPTPATVAWGYYWSEAAPVLRVNSGDYVRIRTVLTSDPSEPWTRLDPPQPRAQPRDRRGGETAHRPGPDDQHPGVGKGPQEVGGHLETGLDQRHADAVDARLGVRSFAHPEGLLEQRAERTAGLTPFLGTTKRLPQLPQDLALAHRHFVQTASPAY